LLPAVIFLIYGTLIFTPACMAGDSLEKQFRELPMEAKRLTGPLFWLHGDESKERLEMYLEKVAESGNGCFTAESRPHKDWLGEGWYRDLDICLQAAKKHNSTCPGWHTYYCDLFLYHKANLRL